MTCRPADLVLIPFPYADLRSSKKRPVLVLTAPDQQGVFIALAVTSVQPREHAVELGTDSLASGTLPRRSWVRQDKIFTLGEDDIVKTLGRVTPGLLRAVLDGLWSRQRVGFYRLPEWRQEAIPDPISSLFPPLAPHSNTLVS